MRHLAAALGVLLVSSCVLAPAPPVERQQNPRERDDGDGDGERSTVTATIGAAGGEVVAEGAALDIPPNAVPEDVEITIEETAASPTDGTDALSPVFAFGPDGLVFQEPVTVTFVFDGNPQLATVFWSIPDDDGYEDVGGTVDGATISAPIVHFSTGFCGQVQGEEPPDEDPIHVVRVLAYHELTTRPAAPSLPPMIAANGSRIAWETFDSVAGAATAHAQVVSTDGTGFAEIDAYTNNRIAPGGRLVISGDGTTVAHGDPTTIRVVNLSGDLIGRLQLTGAVISSFDMTADSAKVFFIAFHDSSVEPNGGVGPNTPLERGVWVMNRDGSGLTQLVGPSALAAMLGTTADAVDLFYVLGTSIGVSADGNEVAFGATITGLGEGVFGVDGIGTNLHTIVAPQALALPSHAVLRLNLSRDGSVVAFKSQLEDGSERISTVGFSGLGLTVPLASPTIFGQGSDALFQLDGDASNLLVGQVGLLAPVDGERVSLFASTPLLGQDRVPVGSFCCSPAPNFTMNQDATLFAYEVPTSNFPTANVPQVAVLQFDPVSLGAAPSVGAVSIVPATVPRDGATRPLISAAVSGTGLIAVGLVVIQDGVEGGGSGVFGGALALLDDGVAPDDIAGDGVFTTNGPVAFDYAEAGARTIRIKAEATIGGLRHATAVDVGGFEFE